MAAVGPNLDHFRSDAGRPLIQNLRASLPGWDVQHAAGGEWMPGIGVRRREDGATAVSLIVACVRTAATCYELN